MSIKITIERGQVHNVNILGDFTGPFINLDLSPALAYELLLELEKNRAILADLAQNYYDCRECGETHRRTVQVCPTLKQKGRLSDADIDCC